MAKKAVIKGLLKKAKPKGMLKAKPKGVPTKAGLMARRSALRGETTAEKLKKTMGDPQKALRRQTKKPLIGKTEKGIGIGVAGTLAYQEIKKGQMKNIEKKTKRKRRNTIVGNEMEVLRT